MTTLAEAEQKLRDALDAYKEVVANLEALLVVVETPPKDTQTEKVLG